MTAVPNHLTTEVQDLGSRPGMHVDHEFADGGIVLGDDPGSRHPRSTRPSIETAASDGGWRTPPARTCARRAPGLRLVLDGVER